MSNDEQKTASSAKDGDATLDVLTALRNALQHAPPQPPLGPLEEQAVADRIAERGMRTSYANWWLVIVAAQLAFLNFLMLAAGYSWLSYSDWLLHAFSVATLAEIFGIVAIITRSLFPPIAGKA